jgi:hypothetical protein
MEQTAMREEYKTISVAEHVGRSWVSIRNKLIENSGNQDVNIQKPSNEGTFFRRGIPVSGYTASPVIR